MKRSHGGSLEEIGGESSPALRHRARQQQCMVRVSSVQLQGHRENFEVMAPQYLPLELAQVLLSVQATAALNEMRATVGSKAAPAPGSSPVKGPVEEAHAMAVPEVVAL